MPVLIGNVVHQPCLLPLLVFVAETCVLTLATLRTITIARGKKLPAAVLGFFEVSIWLFAIGQVMQNLSDAYCALCFAAGFALGNYLGVLIEQTLALGSLNIQITTNRDASGLTEALHLAGFGVTRLHGRGSIGPVEIVVTVVQRKDLPAVAAIIEEFDPRAFYSVHDLQSAAEGVFPKRTASARFPDPLGRVIRGLAFRNAASPLPFVLSTESREAAGSR